MSALPIATRKAFDHLGVSLAHMAILHGNMIGKVQTFRGWSEVSPMLSSFARIHYLPLNSRIHLHQHVVARLRSLARGICSARPLALPHLQLVMQRIRRPDSPPPPNNTHAVTAAGLCKPPFSVFGLGTIMELLDRSLSLFHALHCRRRRSDLTQLRNSIVIVAKRAAAQRDDRTVRTPCTKGDQLRTPARTLVISRCSG